jgi:hypothetical protein
MVLLQGSKVKAKKPAALRITENNNTSKRVEANMFATITRIKVTRIEVPKILPRSSTTVQSER